MLLLAIIDSGSGATRWSAAPPAAVASGRCLRRHDYFSQISCWTPYSYQQQVPPATESSTPLRPAEHLATCARLPAILALLVLTIRTNKEHVQSCSSY
jgi:hypothetical protein